VRPSRQDLEAVIGNVHYHGGSRETERAIVRAIARLPGDVRDFALDRCQYISCDPTLRGYFLPASITEHDPDGWLVILNLEGLEWEDAESVVAHEIAHLLLGHKPFGHLPPGPERGTVAPGSEPDEERQVRELVMRWGFGGIGTARGGVW
jgi:hypothetical protein